MKNNEYPGPCSVACYDYTDKNGDKKLVSAIIVPIAVEQRKTKTTISYACCKALSCCNLECRYSKASQDAQDDQF